MPRLLVVHHTPSPATHAMYEAVIEGTGAPQIENVEVVHRAALAATAVDVLEADGFVLGTPANLGYMSGALKHFFDTIYNPCLEATRKAPYGIYLHGNSDTEGALLAVAKITTGLGWREGHAAVQVKGEPGREDLDACWDLGATIAALVMGSE